MFYASRNLAFSVSEAVTHDFRIFRVFLGHLEIFIEQVLAPFQKNEPSKVAVLPKNTGSALPPKFALIIK